MHGLKDFYCIECLPRLKSSWTYWVSLFFKNTICRVDLSLEGLKIKRWTKRLIGRFGRPLKEDKNPGGNVITRREKTSCWTRLQKFLYNVIDSQEQTDCAKVLYGLGIVTCSKDTALYSVYYLLDRSKVSKSLFYIFSIIYIFLLKRINIQ
jgi:hypothetical protein